MTLRKADAVLAVLAGDDECVHRAYGVCTERECEPERDEREPCPRRFEVGQRVRVLDDPAEPERFATVVEVEPSIRYSVFVQFDDHAELYAFHPDELVPVPWRSGIADLPGVRDAHHGA